MKGSVNMDQVKLDTKRELLDQIVGLEEDIVFREADIKMHRDIIATDEKVIDSYKKKIKVLQNLITTLD